MIVKIINKKLWPLKCPYSMVPEFIVIHNTSNDASAQNESAYMEKNSVATSFHFVVDDIDVIQLLPLERNAWHAGDGSNGAGNRKGIAIEICYSKSGGDRFLKAEENAAKLSAELLEKFGWDVSYIKKHQDFSGKYCPHRTLDMGWERFVKKVSGYMTHDLTETDEIVSELEKRGIITNKELWFSKLDEDEDAYWLARKAANYIREL